VIDKKNEKILRKNIIKNPYFKEGSPHGARFAKAIRADKIITPQIGKNAKQSLENFAIKIEIIPLDKKLNELLKDIEGEKN
ncbi:hypothetical protein J7K86_00340, partial [bacterium]|nr:hypothetical protein [bacterium]